MIATRREWLGLGVIALPCLLYSMDLTVLELALPTLSAQLRPTSTELLWIVDVYGFVLASALVMMGTLGDRIGRRRLLLIGAGAFATLSVVAAFATTAKALIASRALLGLAGATLAPSTLSMIRGMFRDPAERSIAIGIWVTSYSVGGAIGPLVGGVLLTKLWWGSVFLVSVPVMLLLVILGPVLLPESRDPIPRRLDVRSAVLSLAAVLALIYGFKRIAIDGFSAPPGLSVIAGIVFGAVFVRRQRRLADPLMDLALFLNAAFRRALIAYALGAFVGLGMFVLVAQFQQGVLGLSPWRAGLWTTPFAIAFIVGSQVASRSVRVVRPAIAMIAGLSLAGAGFGGLACIGADASPATVAIASFVFCLGLSPVFTLATDVMLAAAPPERAGAVAALSETASELGGALGIAVLGSIGSAVYRRGMATVTARDARESLGGALALHDPVIAQSARDAFASSVRITALTAAGLAFGLALLLMVYSQRRLR